MGNRLLRLRECSRDWEGGLSGCDMTSGGQTARATGREGPLRGSCTKTPTDGRLSRPLHKEDLQSRLPRPLRKEDLQSRLPRPHGASLSTIFEALPMGTQNKGYLRNDPFGNPLGLWLLFETEKHSGFKLVVEFIALRLQ